MKKCWMQFWQARQGGDERLNMAPPSGLLTCVLERAMFTAYHPWVMHSDSLMS